MKRVILFVVTFLFLFSLSSAQNTQVNTCPTDDDIILRISSGTNAHGEVWNGAGSYTAEVCYSQIFGTPYTGTNPHTCSSGNSNSVLRLSSSTNAHAEIISSSTPPYTNNVCYGDLVCQSVAGDTVCPANTQEIVSLSGSTNAHLETASANSYSSSGNYKICCSNTLPSQPGIISVGWSYYDLTPITSPGSALFCPNTAIYAYAITNGLIDGTPVTFNFNEWDPFPLPNQLILGPVTANTVNNVASLLVNFADPTVQGYLNNMIPDLGTQDVELFFEASIATDSEQSEFVRYVNDVNLCVYTPPTATITAPVHQGVYYNNIPVNFVATCTSQSGPINYDWELVQNGNIISNTQSTFQQTFAQGGQVTVKLTCTDLQGNSATSQVQILVVASPYMFAFVNDPTYNGVEYTPPSGTSAVYFPLEVSFSASHSFVVDASGCNINCLGGNCPKQTQNSPSSCGGGPLIINGAPDSPAAANWANMDFDWTFWDSDWTNSGSGFDGAGKVGGFLEYDDLSQSTNDKHLSVTVQTTGTTSASANFQRDFTLGRCLNNGNTLINSAGQLKSTSQANICIGGDGIPNSGDECCPVGQDCMDTDGDNSYSCEFLSNPITKCEDFQDADSCKKNTNPAYPLASNGGILPSTTCTFLKCYWDESIGCGVQQVNYPNNPTTGQCNTQGCVISDCLWTTTQTTCINGRKTITYGGTLGGTTGLPICAGGSSSCVREPITVPCGSLNFELDFFGIRQFIATAIIVALFYAIYGMRKTN